MILYAFLKVLVQIALRVFYKEMVVMGKENIPEKGPLIVAVNHPNTLMDPVIVASLMKQRVGFLGNASLFAGGLVDKLFAILHILPVYRKQDVAPGEKVDNSASFRKVYEYLNSKGAIMIFPEGTSLSEMKLREIKTGTARIALGFEEQNDFKAGVKIMTVALNYSEPTQFRTKVSVTYNPPIELQEYQEKYQADNYKTVRELTQQISNDLAEDLVITEDKDQEALLKQLNFLYQDHLEKEHKIEKSSKAEFSILRRLANGMRFLKGSDTGLYNEIAAKTKNYFETLGKHHLPHGIINGNGISELSFGNKLGNILLLLLFFPLYAFGVITNYIPYSLLPPTASAISSDIEYRAPIMMVAGIVFFPLFYLIETLLFHYFVAFSPWQTLFFVILLPVSGFVAMAYWGNLNWLSNRFRMELFASQNPEVLKSLSDQKGEIIQSLEVVRKENEEISE